MTEQGHKDRSALLRAWLARGGPTSTTGPSSGAELARSTPSIVTFAKDEPRANSRPRHASGGAGQNCPTSTDTGGDGAGWYYARKTCHDGTRLRIPADYANDRTTCEREVDLWRSVWDVVGPFASTAAADVHAQAWVATGEQSAPAGSETTHHPSAPNPSMSATQHAPSSSPSAPASAPTPHVFEQVLSALRREHDPHLGLISIAKVVRSLVPRVPVNDVHAALFALHEQAMIELRPEAGSEFLRDNDAALCPRGPRGTVFSFARLLDRTNTTNGSGDDEAVLSALRKLASREPPGSLLSVRTLRTMQKLPAPRFDAAVLRLSRAGKVILHHHDFPTSLPEVERAMLVQDEHGTHYIGIAPRQGSVSSNET
ncbi:hypothetical protein [Polyangium jinanense]|uniref:Uncharacterized protein n=1 Tax=Polyangium jinanense TaxID=2829994 RepID=A0A9X4AZV0_9BACT|nr:hypothetical protein [Polyangium jinanense]MDC3988700.1 hypothetical protein [Polyangium jinanense]